MGSALLMIGSSERQVGLNDRSATQALYLGEAAVERARLLLPGHPLNDVLAENRLLGEWINGARMAAGTYRVQVSNNVIRIGGFAQDGGAAVCASTTCDTDGLAVITGIGTYGGAVRAVRALVEVPSILNLPAPLIMLNAEVDVLLQGGSFLMSGFDRSRDGSSGSAVDRPSVAMASADASAAFRNAIGPDQESRFVGAGPSPSIDVVPTSMTNETLQRLKSQLARQADRVLVNPGKISGALRGDDGTGQVTLIKGEPSADGNQGLDTAADLTLEGSGSGSGVLVSTGQLTVRGSYRFEGVLILVGDGSALIMEDDAMLIGSVLIANQSSRNQGRAGLRIRDRAQLHYSQETLRDAARLLSAPIRHWQEIVPD